MTQRSAFSNVVIVTEYGDGDSTWDGKVKNLVYDVGSMAWVAETQAAGASGSSDATAANQTTEIAKLTSIDGKLPTLVSSRVPVDGSGVTQPVSIAASISTKAPVNATGSGSAAGATVSTAVTLSAPANAVGFILMNLETSTTNMRWSVGRTASATLGQQLQPGRDTGFIPVGANISIIAESGTCNYDVQWVSQ